MAVTRYYNPETEQWEPIGISIPGPRGFKGDPGPEGDIGPPGTQVYYEAEPPPYPVAQLGDLWLDPTAFVIPEKELPEAGTTGQALVKSSDTNYDVEWTTIEQVPPGGDEGQILTKNSGTDHDTSWMDPPSGGMLYAIIFG